MEEKKEKKKINKKALLVLFTLAIVFAIIGFVDIKSNAAENQYSASIEVHFEKNKDGKLDERSEIYSWVSDSPIQVYLQNRFEIPEGEIAHYSCFVVSESPLIRTNGDNYSVEFIDSNGKTLYFDTRGGTLVSSVGYDEFYIYMTTSSNNVIVLNQIYYKSNFAEHYINGTLDFTQQIDYENLQIDDNMPYVSEIKRNYIMNHYSSPGEEGITQPSDIYEYLIWSNSSDLPIQLEVVPVVQYYKTLFGKSDFLEEYIGEWRDYELLDGGTTKYLRQTDDASLLEKYNEDYQFKKACLSERRVNVFTETAYFFYGYRLRYVDVENEKAGPWTVVMPCQTVNESEKWQEYSDNSISNSSNSSGEISDTNYGDVDKNIEEIEETINFKDKYDVVDGNANTQEVINWLNTVVTFIKGTPDLVTEVLSFLPQPILYGMYITIFLGVFASAIAIIKALI